MPFLPDSLTTELTRHGFGLHIAIHPVFVVERSPDGELLAVLGDDEARPGEVDTSRESFHHIEIDRQADAAVLDRLRLDLIRVLGDVRAANEDQAAMRERALSIAGSLDAEAVTIDRRRPGGGGGLPPVARRRPLHVPRLPRVRARAGAGRGGAAVGRRIGSRHPAEHRRKGGRASALDAAARRAAKDSRARPAQPDEGQLPGDGAARELSRLRRDQAVRRERAGRSASGVSSGCTRGTWRSSRCSTSRSCGGRCGPCSTARPTRGTATRRRCSSTSWTTTRGTSSCSPGSTTCTATRSRSSSCSTGSGCGCGSAATTSGGSSPASSTFRSAGSPRRSACASATP